VTVYLRVPVQRRPARFNTTAYKSQHIRKSDPLALSGDILRAYQRCIITPLRAFMVYYGGDFFIT
jgi:hypothetical protein